MSVPDLTSDAEFEKLLFNGSENDVQLKSELLKIQNEVEENFNDFSLFDSLIPLKSESGDEDDEEISPATGTGKTTMREITRLAKQISREINVKDDENDESVDQDSELLAELSSIISGHESAPGTVKTSTTTQGVEKILPSESTRHLVGLIEDRLKNYKDAQEAAKDTGDAAKLRRLERGIGTLQEQLTLAFNSEPVDQNEIPPPVLVSPSSRMSKSILSSNAAEESPSTGDVSSKESSASTKSKNVSELLEKSLCNDPNYAFLLDKRNEYRKMVLEAKDNGKRQTLLEYYRMAKQFDQLLKNYQRCPPIHVTKLQMLTEKLTRRQTSDVPVPEELPFEELFAKFAEMKGKAVTLAPEERKIYAEKVVMEFWKSMGGDESELAGLEDSDEGGL